MVPRPAGSRPEDPRPAGPPDISVIITTKNEERHIADCLLSVTEQDYPQEHIEIIVVDNHSTDRTVAIAGEYTEHVHTCGPERSAQRNYGVEHAVGKYVLYLDADMILSTGVISECVERCEREHFIALYIPEVIISRVEEVSRFYGASRVEGVSRRVGTGFWIAVRNFERSFYNATCIDGVRFVSRAQFRENGGFDLTLFGGEDWDFDRRLTGRGSFSIITSPLYHNEGSFALLRYLRKKAYYATSLETYIAKWGKDDPVIRKQLGIPYRFFGVFIERGKWKHLLAHPVLAAGMYLLRVLVGLVYIQRTFKRSFVQRTSLKNSNPAKPSAASKG